MGIGSSHTKPSLDEACRNAVPPHGPEEKRTSQASQDESWRSCSVGKEINYTVSGRGDAVSVVRSIKSTSCGDSPPTQSTQSVRSNQQIRGTPCIDVVNTDMPQERQEYAIEIMMKAVRNVRMFRDVAEVVKKEMDIKFGSAWQCVVGREFGINISHMYGYFLFVTLDSLAILLYKTD
ncbi:uncharacterized protein [Halyomorpha halys]|uniref:uncharacterized protein isoform X2 n=1 Tax=Halyomorpha halys TaxID=286706 RepID=UPI0006D4DE72|nr:uncharacterized protein LOC106687560 isoform X2 [Halyomorpha halys]